MSLCDTLKDLKVKRSFVFFLQEHAATDTFRVYGFKDNSMGISDARATLMTYFCQFGKLKQAEFVASASGSKLPNPYWIITYDCSTSEEMNEVSRVVQGNHNIKGFVVKVEGQESQVGFFLSYLEINNCVFTFAGKL